MLENEAPTITLGEMLKRKREERGVELTQIAEATRISVRFLRAIEENDFKSLPGGLFTRSFIRAYARYVGMDENAAVALYYEQTGEPEEKRYDLHTEVIRARVRSSLWANVVILLAVLAVLAIGGFAGWHYWKRSMESRSVTPAQQPLESAQSPPTQPATSPGTSAPVGTEPTTPTEGEPSSQLPPTSTGSPNQPADQSPSQPSEKETTLSTSPPSQATSSVTQLQLNIEAQDECWVSVQADDAAPRPRTLRKGETISMQAKDRLVITVGNVPRVNVTINGQPVTLPQTKGVVASEVVITAENLPQFIKR
jgi:cytoskeletal protein RodZ